MQAAAAPNQINPRLVRLELDLMKHARAESLRTRANLTGAPTEKKARIFLTQLTSVAATTQPLFDQAMRDLVILGVQLSPYRKLKDAVLERLTPMYSRFARLAAQLLIDAHEGEGEWVAPRWLIELLDEDAESLKPTLGERLVGHRRIDPQMTKEQTAELLERLTRSVEHELLMAALQAAGSCVLPDQKPASDGRRRYTSRYNSPLKKAVLVALLKAPQATDQRLCDVLDEDGCELPPGWVVNRERSFMNAYRSSKHRHDIESVISKVRKDMRRDGFLS